MKTAKFIKKLEGWSGKANLYKVSPPMKWGWEKDKKTKYVVVSGIDGMFATETYIFPAKFNGETKSMTEMNGSFKGEVSHVRAFENVGYKLI